MAGVPEELLPYLVGDYSPESGEWALRCPKPAHEDVKRSASLNVSDGLWYCFGCGEGGKVESLIKQISSGNGYGGDKQPKASKPGAKGPEPLSDLDASRWHKFLMSRRFRKERVWIMKQRGLTADTLRRYSIGYNPMKRVWTIPV